MERKAYVYKITCNITGEYYFGSSFKAKSNSYWGSGRKIRERIKQYGIENFTKEILHEFDDRVEAHRKENDYIEQFRNDEKCLNYKCEHKFGTYGEETRKKIGAATSIANRGKILSEETRKKIGAANYGNHPSTEARERMSISHQGKHFTEEHRKKIGAAKRGNKNMLGKHLSEETCKKISKIMCGNKNVLGKHWRLNKETGKREYYD